MKGTICIAAIAALIGTPTLAADIAVKAPPPAPPPAPVFSWTGCYLGGHVGGGWVSKQFNGPFSAKVPSFFALTAVVPLSDNTVDVNGSGGFLGGVQAGCNYQYAPNWVVGIDGDASWGSMTASTNQNESTNVLANINPPVTGAVANITNSRGTLSAKTDFIGTLTGRFGYTEGRTMIYAKAGAAWTHDKYSFNGQVANSQCLSISLPPPPSCSLFAPSVTTPFSFNASETRFGWTIGGGMEWAFWGNWSTKLEYDFLDFGTHNVTFTDGTFGSQTIGVRQRISEVKLGVNYLFNWH